MAERTPRFYDVPAGTEPSQCNGKARGGSCTAIIYWIEGPNGRPLPIDCDVDGGEAPSPTSDRRQGDMFAASGLADVHDGRGVLHHSTCPDVKLFRSRAKESTR